MQKILIVLFMISLVSIPFASAHPYTEETIPSLTSNAPAGTTEVIVFFSEAIDINFSSLKVFDTNGNQIDNKDTAYFEGEESLIVTTPPLEDGVYTVSTKVLSKVDGHLVPGAFLFAVGDVVIDPSLLGVEQPSELIFFPEAGARYPGLVGQTIVLGAVIASLIIWGTQNKQSIREELEKIQSVNHRKFMSVTGIGLALVFISNIFLSILLSLWPMVDLVLFRLQTILCMLTCWPTCVCSAWQVCLCPRGLCFQHRGTNSILIQIPGYLLSLLPWQDCWNGLLPPRSFLGLL